jgi:glutamyl-tRNA synthetase
MSQRGRFAPSPTGELHLGNARTALLAWLWAQREAAGFTMRIEDLDRPRCKPGLAGQQLEELRWLGLDWDDGPYRQSERGHLYDAAIEQLRTSGRVYECFCSRAQIKMSQTISGQTISGQINKSQTISINKSQTILSPSEASAPHGPADDGPRYPGTCAKLSPSEVAERKTSRVPALRFRVPPGFVEFTDLIAGPQRFDPSLETGDFVLRRADGIHSYQLAVVVDDAAMQITQVLRGADLLPSTARQILLYRALGFRVPAFAHAPLMHGPPGPDGQPERLSKRAGAETLSTMKARGDDPRRIVATVARSCGLVGPAIQGCSPRDLVADFSLDRIAG